MLAPRWEPHHGEKAAQARNQPHSGTLWSSNLRGYLKRKEWEQLREEIKQKHHLRCQTCRKDVSAPRAAQVHEVWEYETASSPAVAYLKGLTLVCWHCHMSEHWGKLSGIAIGKPHLLAETIAHYCKVNEVSRSTWARDKDRAFAAWDKLNKLEWEIDWGDYAPMLPDFLTKKPRLRLSLT